MIQSQIWIFKSGEKHGEKQIFYPGDTKFSETKMYHKRLILSAERNVPLQSWPAGIDKILEIGSLTPRPHRAHKA